MKYNLDSFIKRCEKKFVTQDFFQIHGINYKKTFISTIRYKLLKIFIAIATMLKIILI